MDRQQGSLPLAEAEGAFAERKQALGLALVRVQADLHLTQLMLWIFNATAGGRQTFIRTYEDLAARPWGLCCSPSTAKRRVADAKHFGWISVTQTRRADGGDGPLEIEIDWQGIVASHNVLRRPCKRADDDAPRARPQAAQSAVAHGQPDYPGGQPDYPGGQPDHAIKEDLLLTPLDTNTNTAAALSARATNAHDVGTSSDGEWAAAAAELEGVGVERIGPTLDRARERGLTPAEVRAIAATFDRHRSRLNGPGAIVARIRDGCWPAAVEEADRQASARRSAADDVRRRWEARREACAAEASEFERLELLHGRDVDAAEKSELAARLAESGSRALVPLLTRFGRASKLVRRRLLELFDEGASIR